MAAFNITLRPATKGDAPRLLEIHSWYVENTVLTFQHERFEERDILGKIDTATDNGLPYIVAVSPQGEVLGHCSASKFRSAKFGYVHTVEISLFLHHEHRRQGTGPILLKKLLEIMREPRKYPDYITNPDASPNVQQVLAVMGIDETGPKNGLALKEFYEKFGFVEVGHLRKVGYKFGKWIDTMYMQLSLQGS